MKHQKLTLFSALLLAVLIVLVTLQAYRYPIYDAAINMEAKKSRLTKQKQEVNEFSWVYYRGPQYASADTFVLIHGFAASKENWLRYARYLTDRYNVIIPDLPGHGESSSSESTSYAIDAQANRLHAFLQALDIRQVHLVGNSMGGAISAVYSAHYPQNVATLTLIDPAGILDVPSQFAEELKQGRNPLIVSRREDFTLLLDFALEKKPFIPWPVSQVAAEKAMIRKSINNKIFADLRNKKTDNFRQVLTSIQAPTLIIWGDQDRVINVKNGQTFNQMIPVNELRIMKGIGHAPMIEVPNKSASMTLEWVNRHAR